MRALGPILLCLAGSVCWAATPLPDGFVDSPYGWTLQDCFQPVSCDATMTGGILPPGLVLDNLELSGTPTTTGVFTFTVEIANKSLQYTPLPPLIDIDFTIEIKTAGAPRGHITVDRNAIQLAFAAGGVHSSPQAIRVNLSGPGRLGWTLNANSTNVFFSTNPTPSVQAIQTATVGTQGSGILYLQANYLAPPTTFPATTTITVQETSGDFQQIVVTLTQSTGAAPFGVIDTPTDNSAVIGAIPVTGWALDDVEVLAVDIYRDAVVGEPAGTQIYIGSGAFIPDARPDVAKAYPNEPLNYRAGWGLLVLTNVLPNSDGSAGRGNGTYRLSAYARNVEGKTTLLGTKHITVDNAHSALPFGTLDTPDPLTPISGMSANFGWALTPQPSKIPLDGSTITVYIDGQPVAHPVYNNFRSDIASTFPGLVNSNGAVGYYVFDSSALANGMHTIGWIVIDNQGNAAGIGSRSFVVQNFSATGPTQVPELPPEASKHAVRRVSEGMWEVDAAPMDRIGIDLSAFDLDEAVPFLPPGATTDRANRFFYWQLAPGQAGTHEIRLGAGVRLRVRITQ